jgi:Glyoxalase-like domain
MHRSRLSTFVIDCQGLTIDAAADFWSRVLGRKLGEVPPDAGDYRDLTSSAEEPMLIVQRVDHPGRIHLDIETDDMEAEVKRLEGLGAKRVAFVRRWWVMEAPTGQRFCVVNPQRGPLDARANAWNPDGTPAAG